MKIEQADPSIRYMESWNLINEITGRKSAQSSQLNGNSAEESILLWYKQFRNLFGSTLKITDENEKIPAVFENLNINDGKFTSKEYEKAKRS